MSLDLGCLERLPPAARTSGLSARASLRTKSKGLLAFTSAFGVLKLEKRFQTQQLRGNDPMFQGLENSG